MQTVISDKENKSDGHKNVAEKKKDTDRIRKTMAQQLADFDVMKKALMRDLQNRCEKVSKFQFFFFFSFLFFFLAATLLCSLLYNTKRNNFFSWDLNDRSWSSRWLWMRLVSST